MNMRIMEARNRLRRELTCINMTVVIIFAVVTLLLGIFFAIGGVDLDMCDTLIFPHGALSSFFFCLFFGLALGMLGAAMAIYLTTPDRRGERKKTQAILLYLCISVMIYTWIPITFLSATFFLSVLMAMALLGMVACLFSLCLVVNRIAGYLFFAFGVWILYLLYFSFGMLILN